MQGRAERPGRPGRAVGALRQLAEYLLATILMVSALHAPKGAVLLLVAAVLVGGWTAVHDSPLAAIRAVGGTLHRVGLAALAVGLAVTVVVTGHLSDLFVAGPILFVALLLLRLAVPRRRPVAGAANQAPDLGKPTGTPPAAPAPEARPAGAPLARVTGIAAARAGNVVSAQVDRAVPAGARHAGRLVGRLTNRRSNP
jgi:hypothetical protein